MNPVIDKGELIWMITAGVVQIILHFLIIILGISERVFKLHHPRDGIDPAHTRQEREAIPKGE